jgi:hypothetical protein
MYIDSERCYGDYYFIALRKPLDKFKSLIGLLDLFSLLKRKENNKKIL